MIINNKCDFAVIVMLKNANPNGDPLNGNRPRTLPDNTGEISDVALKRKLRDRLGEAGHPILVQSDDRKTDLHTSLRDRADSVLSACKTKEEIIKLACKQWIDVRAFGQLFAFKSKNTSTKKKSKNSDPETDVVEPDDQSVSIGIRGPVTIQPAFSIKPVEITSTQITKSLNGENTKDGRSSSDRMGMKHRVNSGTYVFFGSINPQLAEKTGFSDEDANILKNTLPRIFENDASSSRPEGSMWVHKVVWWKHNNKCGQMSSAKVHKSLTANDDGSISFKDIGSPEPEIIDGF